jgi:cyclic pyranopterin phosphate synthase
MALIDSYGRRINYLRLSVTDRCNMRCSYCMPSHGVSKLTHGEMLSYEDLLRVAREAVAMGIEKVRITGGEPLVRKGIVGLIERLADIPGMRELVLTTNGLLLGEMAHDLRRAGVRRLNISLDSLNSTTFAGITRGGDLHKVLDGIAAAEVAGFPPVKINMVVMRGVNDDEVLDFASLTLQRGCTVRFIEYMPTIREKGWEAHSVPGSEILERIARHYPLVPLVSAETAGPARNYKIRGAAGAIGIITPISGHFCDSCNRIRVTAAGVVKGCLFAGEGTDLKPYLRSADDGELREALRRIVTGKPGRHRLADEGHAAFAMSQVGGSVRHHRPRPIRQI